MGEEKKKMGFVTGNQEPGTRNQKLYILHGWAYSTEKWEPFLKLIKQNGVESELPKIPGLTAPLRSAWTMDDYVDWLSQITKNQKRITILGHSNGGRIAAAFTAKFPEKVSKLVLIDSAGLVRRDVKTVFKKLLFKTAAKIGKGVADSDSVRNLFYKVVGEEDYRNADSNLKKTMVNLISHELTREISKIKSPTLIIWGKDDKVTPLYQGKRMHELISGSILSVIEGAKHSPQFSHPKLVLENILDFLKEEA